MTLSSICRQYLCDGGQATLTRLLEKTQGMKPGSEQVMVNAPHKPGLGEPCICFRWQHKPSSTSVESSKTKLTEISVIGALPWYFQRRSIVGIQNGMKSIRFISCLLKFDISKPYNVQIDGEGKRLKRDIIFYIFLSV